MPQDEAKARFVNRLQLADDPTFTGFLVLRDTAQQERTEGRRDRYGDQQRGQDRDDVGEAQGFEHAPFQSAQEEQRNENHNDDEGRHGDGRTDLA